MNFSPNSILIGHSAGGLINLAAARQGKGVALISMGMPLLGAPIMDKLIAGTFINPVNTLVEKFDDSAEELQVTVYSGLARAFSTTVCTLRISDLPVIVAPV